MSDSTSQHSLAAAVSSARSRGLHGIVLNLAAAALLAGAVWMVYGRAVNAPFIFDDHGDTAMAQQIETWLTNYRAQQAHPQGASTQSGTVHPSL